MKRLYQAGLAEKQKAEVCGQAECQKQAVLTPCRVPAATFILPGQRGMAGEKPVQPGLIAPDAPGAEVGGQDGEQDEKQGLGSGTQVEAEADDKLNKFLESHPDGFHYTFRSKDGKVVRDYDYRTKKYDVFDGYNLLQEAFNNFNKLLNF